MHLRIELLGRWDGFIGPGDVAVSGQILLAVGRVPGVFACCPWKRRVEGGQQVIQSPGHDGVVVESNVQSNNADGKANTYKRVAVKKKRQEKFIYFTLLQTSSTSVGEVLMTFRTFKQNWSSIEAGIWQGKCDNFHNRAYNSYQQSGALSVLLLSCLLSSFSSLVQLWLLF